VGCNWFETPPQPSGGEARKASVAPAPPLVRPQLVSGCGAAGPVRSGLTMLGCPGRGATFFTNRNTAHFQKTTCGDWRHASRAKRMRMVYSLASAATRSDPENHGPTLAETTAYDALQSRCAPRYARTIQLYEIYTRAASFQFLGRAP
jgi:hypothetical protein